MLANDSTLSRNEKHLADWLFALNAIQFGSFTLKLHEEHPEAPKSPIFLNLRTPDNPKPGPLTPGVVELIGSIMYQNLRGSLREGDYSYIAGLPNAGTPLADALMTHFPSFGKVKQLHLGKVEVDGKRQITGIVEKKYKRDRRILLVDDLITGADSKFEAIAAVEADGLQVHDLLVLIDREQGGRVQLERQRYQLHSCFTLTALLNYYVATARINATKAAEVKDYIKANS